MKRTITPLMALFVVTALLVAPAAATVADDGTESDDENDVEPGEHLAGVVGVQEAEFDGDIAERTFGVKVAAAASDEARADVVGEQLADVEQRLDDLEQRADDLEQARTNGDVSEGQYRAKMATVAVEKANAKRLSDRSATVADRLPADVRESKGIDADAIRALQERADELGGQEVAEIARSIAGPDVGQGIGDGPSEVPTNAPVGDDRADDETDRGDTSGDESNSADDTRDDDGETADDEDAAGAEPGR